MSFELVIKSAKIATSSGTREGNLLVKDGRIAAVAAAGVDTAGIVAREVVDASGLYALPGMVDLHVHIGEPGKEDKEDATTGTKAAAAGGVTTITVMPNCVPPVNSRTGVLARADLFKSKSYVDFALLGGAGGESLDHIVEQAEAGVVGYKSYVGSYREDRRGLLCQGNGDIYDVLRKVSSTDRFIGYHCEDSAVIRRRTRELLDAGRVDFTAYHESRPEFTEVLATLPLMEIAGATGARLYLVHISCARIVELAEIWRNGGADITIETCPHYLIFTDEDTARLGPYAEVAPPLRPAYEVEALWEALARGGIDVIATDHAPGTTDEKAKGMKNIFEGGGGLPELEVAWPLMLDQVNRGRASLEDLAFLMAESPARVAGIYPQKGSLEPGSDADIVLVDLHAPHVMSEKSMYTKNQDSARIFDGMKVTGRVEKVFQRGRLISERGRVVMDRPTGAQWVRPV